MRGRAAMSRPAATAASSARSRIAGRSHLTYLPAYKHTYISEVKLTGCRASVKAARKTAGGIELVDVAVKDAGGKLLADAIPVVSIVKDGGYCGDDFGDRSRARNRSRSPRSSTSSPWAGSPVS